MRALFTTQPATGHFNPLVPFAQGLVDAGHEVAFAGADSLCPDVEAAGFVAFPAGLDWRADQMTRFFPDAPSPGPGRQDWVHQLWRHTSVRAMVPDPAFRRNAERLQDEINALPGMDRAVGLLERLAVDPQPLHAAPPVSPTPGRPGEVQEDRE